MTVDKVNSLRGNWSFVYYARTPITRGEEAYIIVQIRQIGTNGQFRKTKELIDAITDSQFMSQFYTFSKTFSNSLIESRFSTELI